MEDCMWSILPKIFSCLPFNCHATSNYMSHQIVWEYWARFPSIMKQSSVGWKVLGAFFSISVFCCCFFIYNAEHKIVLGLTAGLRAGQRKRQIERWRVHGCLHHNKQVCCKYKSMHKHTLICMHRSTHTLEVKFSPVTVKRIVSDKATYITTHVLSHLLFYRRTIWQTFTYVSFLNLSYIMHILWQGMKSVFKIF